MEISKLIYAIQFENHSVYELELLVQETKKQIKNMKKKAQEDKECQREDVL